MRTVICNPTLGEGDIPHVQKYIHIFVSILRQQVLLRQNGQNITGAGFSGKNL
jgi:hypothetical protein